MANMSDLAFSMSMRDIVNSMVQEQIDQLRPRYRYATVKVIDRVNSKCDVIFNGETGQVRVNMGSIQPSVINQVVRIEGIGTDKFITDVLGQPWNGHRYGTVDQYQTNGPVKVTWTGDSTLSGPYNTIVSDYRPRAGDTVIGIDVPGYGLVIAPALNMATSTYDQLKAEPLNWMPLQLSNGWSWYSDFAVPESERYSFPRFTKTRSGIVKLQGLIKGGTVTAGTLIATLPPGYRPAGAQQMFPCQNGSNGYSGGAVDIFSDGRIVARAMSGSYHSLDQIVFPSADVAPNNAWTPISFATGWSNYDASWTPGSFWVDQFGLVWERGLIKTASGAAQPNNQLIATGMPPPSYGQLMHRTNVQSSGNTGGGIYKNRLTGDDAWIGVSGSTTGYVSLDSMPYVKDSGATVAWFPLSDPAVFQNGWTHYDTSLYSTIGCYKTPDGLVLMTGLSKTAVANSGRMFQVPPGCRPRDKLLLMGASANGPCRLDLFNDGWWLAGANNSNSWTSVDSQTWIADH